MSTGLPGPPPAPEFESKPLTPGPTGWVMVLFTGAVGVLSLTFALSREAAADLVVFADDEYRLALGVVGGLLSLLAARGASRVLRGDRIVYDEKTHRRAAARGRIAALIGFSLLLPAVVPAVGEATVSFTRWTKPVYIFLGGLLMLTGLLQQWNPTKTLRRHRLQSGEGRSGTARIVRATDTGMLVNSRPQVAIDLQVDVPGTPPYEVETKVVMEQAKLALLIPGSTVGVRVDVVDASVLEIDWDRWKAPV